MLSIKQISNDQLLLELKNRLEDLATESSTHISHLEEEVQKLSLQLRESEKEKSTFLSNVRNEINNPLTSILGLAESISRLSKEEKIKRLGSLIHQQAFDLDFQMRNIIIAGEIETGEIKPMIAMVNIGTLLEAQIDYLSQKISAGNVTVKIHADDTLYFPVDSNLLQIILINLLANAIEYCGIKKLVTVETWQYQNKLFLQVEDSGEGIPTEKQHQLFKRFKQLDSGSTKQHSGQGLGLSIVHELVSILNGQIELHSRPGEGSKVIIQFPFTALKQSHVVSEYGNESLFVDGEVL